MKRIIAVSLLLLLCCGSLWAADVPADRWRISILASEMSKGSGKPWSNDTNAGIGIGIAYAAASQWDVELTASQQSYVSPVVRLIAFPTNSPEGVITVPVLEFHKYDVHPLDVSVTRHFLTDQPIAPYVRAGVRYVSAPQDPPTEFAYQPPPPYAFPGGPQPVGSGFGFSDRLSGQAGAGVRVRLTPRTALRAEVTRLLRSGSVDFDPLTRFAAGVSWIF
jgi:hypothetical protein